MADNITNKLVQRISVTHTDDEIKSQLHAVLDELETIYSYLIYAKYKEEKLVGWQIEYTVSQNDKYNTLQSSVIIDEIFAILKEFTLLPTTIFVTDVVSTDFAPEVPFSPSP